jgi:hypothetical protein
MLEEMDEWIIAAKAALSWFIEIMGVEEWHRRRLKVVDYFNTLDGSVYDEDTVQNTEEIAKLFRPIAVYSDWMSWYMYLVDSLVDRPTCDDPAQSARIYPFFAAIGRNIDALKRTEGIDKRLKSLLNYRQNKPDDTLFELVVAACYIRNGWSVRFLEERPGQGKTPDLEVTRGDETYPVECKRLAKINEYAERERQEWQKRWKPLANAMLSNGLQVHVEVTFKVPVECLPIDILAKTFNEYMTSGRLKDSTLLSTAELDFEVRRIDMQRVSKHLAANCVRRNSPQMIELITGSYESAGSYTQLLSESEIVTVGKEDGLHVLNHFVGGLHTAFSAKWECIAEESIDQKAKSVTKALSKAVSQMSDGVPGIIHIGYETVNGPLVEFKRHEKIKDTVQFFDYGAKIIESVYCHAIQPLTKVNEWECAETTIYFEQEHGHILKENLLLDPPGLEARDTTHWQEDFLNDIS